MANDQIRMSIAKGDVSTVTASSCSIVIPACNEQDGVGAVAETVARVLNGEGITHEVIVVDDGSTDGTSDAARKAGARVIRHEMNRGYGAAIKTGIRGAEHDVIVITDADGTYPADRIPDLLHRLEQYDMVVGARSGDRVHIPLIRRPAKWLLGKLANYVAGMRIPDLNSGLRAFRRADALALFPTLPDGFSLTTTITMATLMDGGNVSYIPINYHPRKGRSKIHPIRDTLNFFMLVSRLALHFRPMKVFFPVALSCTAISIGKLIYDAFAYGFSLRGTTVSALVLTTEIWLLALVADLIVAQRRMR